jgi:hypothetical protein
MGMVWVARLANKAEEASVRADPESAYDFIQPEQGWETAPILDLDKEWHGTHFLLTKSAGETDDPLSLILGRHEEIGEDLGYGPAFHISNEKLKAFAEAVKSIDGDTLKARFDTKAMIQQGVYLGEVFDEEGDEALAYLSERIDELIEFAAKAASDGLSAFAVIT